MKKPIIDLKSPIITPIERKVKIEEPVLENKFSLNHLFTPAN
jgi:hypothetical protein